MPVTIMKDDKTMEKIRNNLEEFKDELKEEFMLSAYLFNNLDWTDSVNFEKK